MKRYPKYKDSGIEWIGEIPEHWEVIKLKYLINHSTKKGDGNSNINIALENIVSNKNELVGELSRPFEGELKSFNKGDILFNKLRPYLSKVILTETDGECVSELLVFKDVDEINMKFLYRSVSSPLFINVVDNSTYGAKMPRASVDFILNLPIAKPKSEEEQNQIANYLDHQTGIIDQLIEKKKLLIKKLKEQRQTIINEAVTKGLDPNAKLKDSGIEWIGEIPEHWRVAPLKYYVNIIGGYAFSSQDFVEEGVQLVKIANLYKNKLSLERQPTFITKELAEKHSDYKLYKNDILMSLTGTLGKRDYGYAILANEDQDLIINQRVAKITTGEKFDVRFSIYQFQSEDYLNKLFQTPAGTKQGNLSCDNVVGIRMAIPPTEEQTQIANYLDHQTGIIDQIVEKTQLSIEKLEEQRRSIISEAVTGKVDLRDWEKFSN